MPYESWVDRQIREAIERGEFDNLPGQGRPIKGLNGRDDENWWVKAYLEREQLPLPLPTSLALRKEVMALPETLADITDERSVREIVADLNHRIAESYRRRLDGPPIIVRLVDVEQAVADWRRRGPEGRSKDGESQPVDHGQGTGAYDLGSNVMQLAVVLLASTHQHLKCTLLVQLVSGHHNPYCSADGAVRLQCLAQLSDGGLSLTDREIPQLVHLVMGPYPRQQLGRVERLHHEVVSPGGEGFHC